MKIILLIFQQHFHQLWLFQRIRRRINEKENKKRKKEEVSTQWTSSDVFILLSIVRDFVVNGNLHTDSGLKNADWKHFEIEFHKQTGLAYSRQSMQSKLSELKRKFVQLNTIRDKVSAKGFEKERFVVVEYYYYTLLS